MEKMIDSIRWKENFDFEDLQLWGVLPIKTLIEKIVETDDATETEVLCNVLQEKISDLDECVIRLDSEHREALQAKQQAAAATI